MKIDAAMALCSYTEIPIALLAVHILEHYNVCTVIYCTALKYLYSG